MHIFIYTFLDSRKDNLHSSRWFLEPKFSRQAPKCRNLKGNFICLCWHHCHNQMIICQIVPYGWPCLQLRIRKLLPIQEIALVDCLYTVRKHLSTNFLHSLKVVALHTLFNWYIYTYIYYTYMYIYIHAYTLLVLLLATFYPMSTVNYAIYFIKKLESGS